MIWCLHGAVGMAEDWGVLISQLAGVGREAQGVDLWSYLAKGMPLEEFGKTLHAEMGAAQDHILVGYSMGGRLALHALLDDPGRWSGAIIISAHPGLRTEEERLMRMAKDEEWAAMALTADWSHFLEKWEGQTILRAEGLAEGDDGRGDRRELEAHRQVVARSFMDWSLGKQEDLRPRLKEVSCPVLWVTGERDEKFSELGRECASLLPQGRHLVVQEAGHRVPWEAPEVFGKQVREWMP